MFAYNIQALVGASRSEPKVLAGETGTPPIAKS